MYFTELLYCSDLKLSDAGMSYIEILYKEITIKILLPGYVRKT
ncbi:hypothetical protein CLOL250_00572 [Clostridium sp. L2-50]|nr:hypothetical protein CLOL250_00572 [Clostridium sp. L2-50]